LPAEELGDPYNAAQGRTHTQVRLMTGELILAADARFIWPKREWRDRADQPLELQIPDIVDRLERLAADSAAKAAERAAEEARYRGEQARRDELRRQHLREANRWRRLRELAERADEAAKVRDFVAKLQSQAGDPGTRSDFADWLAWARQRLLEWDPCSAGIEAVMRDVRSVTEHDYAK
jgi:ElaB/YqjD/DUF883 family membrane-anchored ribosome-binding protein